MALKSTYEDHRRKWNTDEYMKMAHDRLLEETLKSDSKNSFKKSFKKF